MDELLASMESFDPVAGCWMPQCSMSIPRNKLAADSADGRIFLIEELAKFCVAASCQLASKGGCVQDCTPTAIFGSRD